MNLISITHIFKLPSTLIITIVSFTIQFIYTSMWDTLVKFKTINFLCQTLLANWSARMFILSQLKDKIRVTPDLFHLPLEEAIKGELNKRFSNRVIINVGLCISLYDILEIKESFIYQGDGSAHATGNYWLLFKWTNV